MTQIWQGETVVPVTQIDAGPCTIIQIKNIEKDGYSAVQVGYGQRRASLITKPLKGHFKKLGDFRFVREFRLPEAEVATELKTGDKISVKTFTAGDKLTITGISKGKGFQGVVKRHGFHGQDATHGNKDQLRMSGSIGAGGIQHVLKGMRMGGRMGGDKVTLHDVEIISVDEGNNTIFIKGAIPGARNGLVLLSADGKLSLGLPEIKTTEGVDENIHEGDKATENEVEKVKEENAETEIVQETVTEEVTSEIKKDEETVVAEEKINDEKEVISDDKKVEISEATSDDTDNKEESSSSN